MAQLTRRICNEIELNVAAPLKLQLHAELSRVEINYSRILHQVHYISFIGRSPKYRS